MSAVPNMRQIVQKGAPKPRTKAQRGPTEAESRYMGHVASLGCALCLERFGFLGVPCQVHHQRTGIGSGRRASHTQTVGMCWLHHVGPNGVHGMGRRAFEREHGVTEIRLIDLTRERVVPLLSDADRLALGL